MASRVSCSPMDGLQPAQACARARPWGQVGRYRFKHTCSGFVSTLRSLPSFFLLHRTGSPGSRFSILRDRWTSHRDRRGDGGREREKRLACRFPTTRKAPADSLTLPLHSMAGHVQYRNRSPCECAKTVEHHGDVGEGESNHRLHPSRFRFNISYSERQLKAQYKAASQPGFQFLPSASHLSLEGKTPHWMH